MNERNLIPDGETVEEALSFRTVISAIIALCWSIYQILIAKWILMDSTWVRAIHLAFALMLVYINMPFMKAKKGVVKQSILRRISIIDWALGITAAMSSMYLVVFYEDIAGRAGSPILMDVVVGVILIVTLIEATRRTVGPALPLIVSFFIAYSFFGPWLPDLLAFKGISVSRFISQITMDTEGIYGVPLHVSASIVFLFVLFGTMLDRAGGGEFFIKIALALLGQFRGGAAKAAVVGSALTGMVSGSSIANVVTTGTFTIPLMKRLGYPATKAAAIETASSTNSQLAPPIMGAAAFIIAEYVNVPYVEVAKAAAIPAFAAYASLLWITHVEACKLGLRGLEKSELPPLWKTFKSGLYFMLPLGVLIYELVVLVRSPESAIFRAIMFLALLMLIVDPIKAYMNKEPIKPAFKGAVVNLFTSLSAGATNMCGVALATASAGIIVGVISLGLGQQITYIVELVSGGNVFILIAITALAGLILGMGLPTTANYIIMASLTAPIMVQAGANLELFGAAFVVPLLASHMFCFYFGILADVTPPVGLAAYAGAAIAKANPIKTGVQAFIYDIRTAILPFFFFFNHDILLWNIDSVPLSILIFAMTSLGGMAFASLVQGWVITKNNILDNLLLLVATFIFLFPAMLTMTIGMPFELRFMGYLAGLGLTALIVAMQYIRIKRNPERHAEYMKPRVLEEQ